jgi:anti-sigma factor RsiW
VNDELDFLAFRYISDELSDDERAAFELRLVEDQAAREAVARSVELSQAMLAAIESLEPKSADLQLAGLAPREASFPSWYTRIAWMTAGAAACLVGLIGYQFYLKQPIAGPAPTSTTAEVARLADAWSDAQESLRVARDAAAESVEADRASEELVSQEGAPPALGDMSETPSWMLAAVGAEPTDEGDDTEKTAPGGETN